MSTEQNKLVQCDHRENICFCEQLGQLLPIMRTAGKSSWGEAVYQEGWEALQDADVSRKLTGNNKIPSERSLSPEGS